MAPMDTIGRTMLRAHRAAVHACQSHEGAVLEGSLPEGRQLPFIAEFRPMPKLWVQQEPRPLLWSWGSDSERDGGRVPSGAGGLA